VKSGIFPRSGNLSTEIINGTVYQRSAETYPGRYIILRSMVKSVAESEDRMRGQPFGDSADARLV